MILVRNMSFNCILFSFITACLNVWALHVYSHCLSSHLFLPNHKYKKIVMRVYMLLCTLRYLIQCKSKFYTDWLVLLLSNYTFLGIYYKIMSLLHNIVPVQRTMYLILYQRTFQLLINFVRHCCEVPCTPFCAKVSVRWFHSKFKKKLGRSYILKKSLEKIIIYASCK